MISRCYFNAVVQKTQDIEPMVFSCWADVEDGGLTLKQQWVNVSCLLGSLRDCILAISKKTHNYSVTTLIMQILKWKYISKYMWDHFFSILEKRAH